MEEYIEQNIRDKIEEINSSELKIYKKEFEKEGYIFSNGSFEDNDLEKSIYFELFKNDEEYIIFIYYSKKNLELSEYYVSDKSKCTFY